MKCARRGTNTQPPIYAPERRILDVISAVRVCLRACLRDRADARSKVAVRSREPTHPPQAAAAPEQPKTALQAEAQSRASPIVRKAYHLSKGESIRVFPLSNWTELDVWQYIYLENIPIVPLYYAKKRPVVNRDGVWIMVDDDRMPLLEGEVPQEKCVRFRTLGCYPLTGAIESEAETLPDIIKEMLLTKTSERQGRVIDNDSGASMEKKKQEGYF